MTAVMGKVFLALHYPSRSFYFYFSLFFQLENKICNCGKNSEEFYLDEIQFFVAVFLFFQILPYQSILRVRVARYPVSGT